MAIIRLNGGDPIEVLDIDHSPTNVRVGSGTRVHVKVLPGEHTVTVIDAEHPDGTAQFVRFRTEPGNFTVLFGSCSPTVDPVYRTSRAFTRWMRQVISRSGHVDSVEVRRLPTCHQCAADAGQPFT